MVNFIMVTVPLAVDTWVLPWYDMPSRVAEPATMTEVAVAIADATFQRNKVWQTEGTLWREVTIKSPQNGRGLMNYGNTLMAKGDYGGALDHFHRALVLAPQYSVLFVVPLALSMPRRRGLWVAAAVVTAVLAPFAIGDPAGFWRGIIRFQLVQPFRLDSLSLAPFAARLIGGPVVQPFALAGLALGAGVLAFCLRRNPDLPLACATAAAAWAAVLIWNKQSFCNYWWLCSGLLAAASAAPAARETG